MKHLLVLLFLLCVSGQICFAQQTEYAFRIYFKDKNATTYQLSQPTDFLSPRAINRREKFNIAIDSTDLPVCQHYIDSVLAVTSGQWHCQSKWQNTIVITLSDTNKISLLDTLVFFKSAKLVAVYPDGLPKVTPVTSQTIANKPTEFDDNYYAAAWHQIRLCNGQYLHEQEQTGKGILIALIDAGFYGLGNSPVFDSLLQSDRLVDRWNFAEDTTIGSQEAGHGTEVLSVIAGYLPNIFVGTAPDAEIALYTSEDIHSEQPIEEDNWTAAAERADSIGVDLLTTSLGYNTFDLPFPNETFSRFDGQSTFIAQAANFAATKGILVIASAGNEGINSWRKILTPGDADSALTVGAVDTQNIAAAFSGWGPNAGNVIKPDVVGMGVKNAVVNVTGNIQNASGTSLATPVIAGLAACLMQADTMAPPWVLKNLIRSVADLYLQPDSQKGYGLPNFELAYQTLTSIRPQQNNTSQLLFDVYPNPLVTNSLYVRFLNPHSAPLKIRLYNINGKAVWTQTQKANTSEIYELPLPILASGSYRLIVQRGKISGQAAIVIP